MENYVLTISEVANSFEEPLDPVFNVSGQSASDEEQFISLTLTPDDGLLSDRQYHVAIIAINTAGSSTTHVSLCKWKPFTGKNAPSMFQSLFTKPFTGKNAPSMFQSLFTKPFTGKNAPSMFQSLFTFAIVSVLQLLSMYAIHSHALPCSHYRSAVCCGGD